MNFVSGRTESLWLETASNRGYLLGAASLSGLIASWWVASGTARSSGLVGGLALGIASTVLWIFASVQWLITLRGAVSGRRDQLAVQVADTIAAWSVADAEAPTPLGGCNGQEETPARQTADSTLVVLVSGGTLYHRGDCQLLEGKAVRRTSTAAMGLSRRRPCGMCCP